MAPPPRHRPPSPPSPPRRKKTDYPGLHLRVVNFPCLGDENRTTSMWRPSRRARVRHRQNAASAAGGIRTHMPVRTAPFEDAMYTVPSPPRWGASLRPRRGSKRLPGGSETPPRRIANAAGRIGNATPAGSQTPPPAERKRHPGGTQTPPRRIANATGGIGNATPAGSKRHPGRIETPPRRIANATPAYRKRDIANAVSATPPGDQHRQRPLTPPGRTTRP